VLSTEARVALTLRLLGGLTTGEIARAFLATEPADRLAAGPRLRDYHLLPSVRGDLLAKLGRDGEARAEFERAAALTRNTRERTVLLRRAAECGAAECGAAECGHPAG